MNTTLNSRAEMDRLNALGLMMPREAWEKGYDQEPACDSDWLTPEVMAMLDERVAAIENGTAELIPFEESMENLRQYAQLRKERKEVLEYV